MASLPRSSSTSPPARNSTDTPSRNTSSVRFRSASFTSFTIRRQRSDSHFSKPIGENISSSNKRRPSFESRTLVLLSPTTAFDQPSTPSLLTAEDPSHVGAGVSSSIDSGSDDDDDDDDDDHAEAEADHANNSIVAIDGDERDALGELHSHHNTQPSPLPCEKKPLGRHRSVAHAFKEKLHLTSSTSTSLTPKRAKSMFSGFRHGQRHSSANLLASSLSFHEDGYKPMLPMNPKLPWATTEDRDQYGFIKGTQWLSIDEFNEFERYYQPIAARRLQKWRQFLAENNGHWPPPSSKFKRYIRKGIPPELRGQAWAFYSGGEAKRRANPGVYDEFVGRAQAMGSENEFLDVIERDLHRTFPDNIQFKCTSSSSPPPCSANSTSNTGELVEVPAIQALRRLLSAFSLYAPSIGYCQSLNYIAGMLLLFMDEEDAFWTFVALVQDILPPNVYDVTMEGANIDQTILMMLIFERLPQIWDRISGGKSFWECEHAEGSGMPTTSLVTSHWFLTLFINILPTESVLRVWDCLFYSVRCSESHWLSLK
ncbi:rab-GTPase-TBC domain-containing protein [Dichotomocladium elegans]|nr:rab-GTPase-TBC domain-containing protein [Dichotomocladium elegans]